MEDKLKEYGLKIRESDNPERQLIDFDISDGEDNIAWVWGQDVDSVEWECTHPEECVEYSDEDERGECLLCGATCSAHYEADRGNVEDYYWSGRIFVPHEWLPKKTPGGIIGDILKEMSDGKGRNV